MHRMSKQREETGQLTVRLGLSTIDDLDVIAKAMLKKAPEGTNYTRTDALRTSILKGVKLMKESIGTEAAAAAPAAKKKSR